jgi:hypothetical protein
VPRRSRTPAKGEIGLLRDRQALHLLATLVQSTWTVVVQGAQGLRNRDCSRSPATVWLTWLKAPHRALIVAQ